MPAESRPSQEPETPGLGRLRRALLPAAIAALALVAFSRGLDRKPHVDELAYIAQSYVTDLVLSGDFGGPAWLEYPCLDQPPLCKYCIGLSLRLGGLPTPRLADALAWYDDTSGGRFRKPAILRSARWPSVGFGVLGCLALYAVGAVLGDRIAGAVAALLLMANPVYRGHAGRAMLDVPAEALVIATVAAGLWTWRETMAGRLGSPARLGMAAATGFLGGLATLAKLNGALGVIAVIALAALGAALSPFDARRMAVALTGAAIAGAVALGTFLALNPTMTAQPRPMPRRLAESAEGPWWRRARTMIRYRVAIARDAQVQDPGQALVSPISRLSAIATRGFGRFGPVPVPGILSGGRRDEVTDRGAWLWIPWVAAGVAVALLRGRRQRRFGEPPTAWAVLAVAAVAFAAVALFIPVAWARYFLPIQPWSALLAAVAASELGRWASALATGSGSRGAPVRVACASGASPGGRSP